MTSPSNGKLPPGVLVDIGGGNQLYTSAASAWQQMVAAAKADGIDITTSGPASGYRSYDQQVAGYNAYKKDPAHNAKHATPGTSEHGFGAAVDVNMGGKAGAWMTAHAAQYGFAQTVSGEPWHWGHTATIQEFGGKGNAALSNPSSPQQKGGITPGSTALNNMTDDQIKDYIAANYGYAAGYLNVPEVGAILVDAARKGQTAQQVQARIANTDWWKTTTDSVRQFQGIASSDPATAQRMIAQKQASISDQASAMGANIDPATLKTIAWEAISFGWSDAQLNDALIAEMKKDPTAVRRGQMAANVAAVKQIAAQYGLSVSDPQAAEYSLSMLDGKLTQQGLQAMMINQAKGKYPTLSNILDSGITPQQFFAPYQSEAAKLLDVPDASIDLFNDPRFSDVLQVPGDKGPRPMTISEFQQKVRTLPEWKQTQNAQQTAADVTEFISKKFGAVA